MSLPIKGVLFLASLKGKKLKELDANIVMSTMSMFNMNKPELVLPILALAKTEDGDSMLMDWVSKKIDDGSLSRMISASEDSDVGPGIHMIRCPHCDHPILLEPHDVLRDIEELPRDLASL